MVLRSGIEISRQTICRWAKECGLALGLLAGIDNNPAENAIRPIALGRKNRLFIGDRDAGRAAANLLTIITTCKNAKEDPYAYLLDVMQRLPLMTTDEVSSLIPERWVPQASNLAAGWPGHRLHADMRLVRRLR